MYSFCWAKNVYLLNLIIVQCQERTCHPGLPFDFSLSLSLSLSLSFSHSLFLPLSLSLSHTHTHTHTRTLLYTQLTCNNESPYLLQTSDSLWCRVAHKGEASTTVIPHVIEPTPPTGHSLIKVSFTTRLSGSYEIDIRVNNKTIGCKIITRNYIPGTCTCI